MLFEIQYQLFGRDGRIVTRRKSFKAETALHAFIRRLKESENFYRILAYSGLQA